MEVKNMARRGSAKTFFEKVCKKYLEEYRKAYLLLQDLDFMYPALENTLDRALGYKFEGAKRKALQQWGSVEVEKAYSDLELNSYKLREYQKKKGDDS